jgi:hypothetical protein
MSVLAAFLRMKDNGARLPGETHFLFSAVKKFEVGVAVEGALPVIGID